MEQYTQGEYNANLKKNNSLVSNLKVDSPKEVKKMDFKQTSNEISQDQWDEEEEKEEYYVKPEIQAIMEAKISFKDHMRRCARVREDELQKLNLGTEKDSKMVRVSALLECRFYEELHQLLLEFRDVFAWHYTDMKGVDPSFRQHMINLKKDDVPYRTTMLLKGRH